MLSGACFNSFVCGTVHLRQAPRKVYAPHTEAASVATRLFSLSSSSGASSWPSSPWQRCVHAGEGGGATAAAAAAADVAACCGRCEEAGGGSPGRGGGTPGSVEGTPGRGVGTPGSPRPRGCCWGGMRCCRAGPHMWAVTHSLKDMGLGPERRVPHAHVAWMVCGGRGGGGGWGGVCVDCLQGVLCIAS